jgi:archaellum component FlaG (FlaF/FlaG flagellin family)
MNTKIMKKILHKTLATFFIFVSSLIGLSNSNAQTGTLTVSPTMVTEFLNVSGTTGLPNNTGNTNLTMTSSGAEKVLITHQSTKGATTTVETIVINNSQLSFSDKVVNYIQPGMVHTFRLYATTAGSSVLGALLATVIVTGATPAATGTLTASTQNVTELTPSSAPGVTPITNTNFAVISAPGVTPINYSAGTTYLNWSTVNSPRTLITLTKTKQDGSLLSAETVVVNNNVAVNAAFKIAYIQKDIIHTFKLFTATGTSNTDYVKGALLATYVVNGYDPTLGINDQMENRDPEGVTVSNDPFTNQFRIHIIDRKANTLELSMFDIGGKMISAPKLIRADTDFLYDASTLQKGVYLLKITLDNKIQVVRKIIKF